MVLAKNHVAYGTYIFFFSFSTVQSTLVNIMEFIHYESDKQDSKQTLHFTVSDHEKTKSHIRFI